MDKLNREIVRLSVPTIVSNITIPLLGICDTAISGHLDSELFLSAIAVGSVMLNVVFWIFGFLRGGTTGLTANALGAGSRQDISKVLYRALMIAFGAGILLIIFQGPIFSLLWHITGSGNEIKESVREYFLYRIWGSPALLAIIALSGWFVGMQTTFYPMLIAISTNIINILTSYILVFPLGYGFPGVAIGTLISNWVGLLIAFACMIWFLKGKLVKCTWNNLFKGEWLRYFAVNGNLFLRSLFIICVTMGVTAAGARIGNLALAANVIVMQFFQFFSFFMDGFAYSGEAMIGLRAGEGNFVALNQCVKRLLWWTLGTALVFTGIYFGALENITSLLTDKENVVDAVSDLALWVGLIPLVSCWAFIYDGFYIGVTDTFRMMFSTLISGTLFFLITSQIFFDGITFMPLDDNRVVWTAFLAYLLVRGICLSLSWKGVINKTFRKLSGLYDN